MEYTNNNISIDNILNGEVILKQFKDGYRVGIDAVLLASMVSSNKVINVLDLGAGVGAVSFCILYRLPLSKVTSIENNKSYYNLSLENYVINNFATHRYTPLLGELDSFKELFSAFDIVLSNPPYYKSEEVRKSNNYLKNVANIETSANLLDFISNAYQYLKHKGTMVIIQKTSRLLDILNNINIKLWGDITIYPIYSFAHSMADRFIITMKKNSKESLKITRGIVIHNKDHSYTNKALDIICKGQGYFN